MTTPSATTPVPPAPAPAVTPNPAEPVLASAAPLLAKPAAWLARTEKIQTYARQHPWKALGILVAVSLAATWVFPKTKHA
jgi:hypothetical protein